MKNTPANGERFNKYEPQKYNCISIDSELEQLSKLLNEAIKEKRFVIHFGI